MQVSYVNPDDSLQTPLLDGEESVQNDKKVSRVLLAGAIILAILLAAGIAGALLYHFQPNLFNLSDRNTNTNNNDIVQENQSQASQRSARFVAACGGKNCKNNPDCCGTLGCYSANGGWAECFAKRSDCYRGWQCQFLGGHKTPTSSSSGSSSSGSSSSGSSSGSNPNGCPTKNCLSSKNTYGGCCKPGTQCFTNNAWWGECFASRSECTRRGGWECKNMGGDATGSSSGSSSSGSGSGSSSGGSSSGSVPPPVGYGNRKAHGPSQAQLDRINAQLKHSTTKDIRSNNMWPPTPPGTLEAAFRTECKASHFSYDDPIVFPGQKDASHLHMFWGNGDTNHLSTSSNMKNTRKATCRGGILNKSGYWAPALLDAGGNPVIPEDLFVYYKSLSDEYGSSPSAIHNQWPRGIRVIAGDPYHIPPAGGETAHTRVKHAGGSLPRYRFSNWFCTPDKPAATRWSRNPTIPSCPQGHVLVLEMNFPNCWDGRLDSPDHRSHLLYPKIGTACRDYPNHKKEIPTFKFTAKWKVHSAQGTRGWRLASDRYTMQGNQGASAHGDWIEGWDNDLADVVLRKCLRENKECGAAMIGDGRSIYFSKSITPNNT